VSAKLTGLSPHTSYRFRLVAANAGGTSEGAEETVVTSGRPAVVTGPAALVAQTSATLTGTVNPNGESLSDCHFDYGSSSSYGARVPCATTPGSVSVAVEVSGAIAPLAPGARYHFRLVASDADGTGSGADEELVTLPAASGEASAPSTRTPAGRTVSAAATVAPAPQPALAALLPALPAVLDRDLEVNASGGISVTLSCAPAVTSCSGAIAIRITRSARHRAAPRSPIGRSHPIVIASARYTVPPGRTITVALPLSAHARGLLGASRRLRGEVVLRDLAGALTTGHVPVTLFVARPARTGTRPLQH
jgi:hypothetical protein